MSRFAVDKVLRQVIIDEAGASSFEKDRDAFLAGFELDDDELKALRDLDYKTLYSKGAHPFLLNSFLMRVWPGDRRAFMAEYRENVAQFGYPDFTA